MLQTQIYRKQSTFYILEEGEADEGERGFWVIDEEIGEEGFTGLYTKMSAFCYLRLVKVRRTYNRLS